MVLPAYMPGTLEEDLRRVEANLCTYHRVTTTRYPIAQTPRELIWTLNKARLYRYVPMVPPEQRHPIPLLLVFALMNRPSIFDLRPGHSFVEYLLKHGYDVFLIDWGVPGPEDRGLTFEHYVLDYLPRAIRKVKAVSGMREFSLLGWCIGAILTTIYAALRPDDGLRNLLLLTAPLDFANKQAGGFVGWVNEQSFAVDKLTAHFDVIPGGLIDYGAKALKPVDNYISTYIRLWDNLDNPRIVEGWHAMNTWVNDLIPMASATYGQLIKDFYRENKLIEGRLVIRGQRVDLAAIRAQLLNVTADADHITPSCQSESIMGLVSSQDKTLLHLKGGHIGMMAGSAAVKQAWPKLNAWLGPRSGSTGVPPT